MFTITTYKADLREAWDTFVRASKNGTMLHLRDYMEYHADRFCDHSLVIHDDKGRLAALLPANEVNDGERVLYSHQGLTYGGLITTVKTQAEQVVEIFQCIVDYLKHEGFSRMIYKPVPYTYHAVPAEEDLYALFKVCNATIIARNIASVIDLSQPLGWSENRRRNAKKSMAEGITVCRTEDYASYWKILSENLRETYDAKPVHTLEEIQRLASSMGDAIQLFMAYDTDNEPLAGTLLYITNGVVRTQYISASNRGKAMHAMDAVFHHILSGTVFPPEKYRFFDFGTSNGDAGHYLQQSLIHQKQGFGGRGVCYDSYEIRLNEL